MSLENEEISNWENFDLDTSLLRGIYSYGFENPSPIQQKAIKPILDGKMLLPNLNQELVKLVVL